MKSKQNTDKTDKTVSQIWSYAERQSMTYEKIGVMTHTLSVWESKIQMKQIPRLNPNEANNENITFVN